MSGDFIRWKDEVLWDVVRRIRGSFGHRAVRLVLETKGEYSTEFAAITSIAAKLGIGSPETLRKWVRTAEVDAGRRPGVTSEESAQLKALRRENTELKSQRDPQVGIGFLRVNVIVGDVGGVGSFLHCPVWWLLRDVSPRWHRRPRRGPGLPLCVKCSCRLRLNLGLAGFGRSDAEVSEVWADRLLCAPVLPDAWPPLAR